MANGELGSRLRRALPRPVLETLSFRGVAPSEEILLLARDLADRLAPLLGTDARCELALVQERWVPGIDTVEARVHARYLDAPVTVFAEEPSALEAVRSAFRSLERLLLDLVADAEGRNEPDAAWPRPAPRAFT